MKAISHTTLLAAGAPVGARSYTTMLATGVLVGAISYTTLAAGAPVGGQILHDAVGMFRNISRLKGYATNHSLSATAAKRL